MMYNDPVKNMRYCSAVCLHKNQTASFYYNFKEVSRTKQETEGLIKNITIGDDSFYCKVFKPRTQEKREEKLGKAEAANQKVKIDFTDSFSVSQEDEFRKLAKKG